MHSELILLVELKKLFSEHGSVDMQRVFVLRRSARLDFRAVVVAELVDVVAPVVWLASRLQFLSH